jgi:NADPH:quinone reductase-like Zn-dependent oxidoreductase
MLANYPHRLREARLTVAMIQMTEHRNAAALVGQTAFVQMADADRATLAVASVEMPPEQLVALSLMRSPRSQAQKESFRWKCCMRKTLEAPQRPQSERFVLRDESVLTAATGVVGMATVELAREDQAEEEIAETVAATSVKQAGDAAIEVLPETSDRLASALRASAKGYKMIRSQGRSVRAEVA